MVTDAMTPLIIRRIFDVPVARLWKAWTDSKQIAKWWGPNGFTMPICEWDPAPDNTLYVEMAGPDGTVYPMNGVFRDVTKESRLVFTSAPLDAKKEPLFDILNTISFVQEDDRTKLIMSAIVTSMTPEAAASLEGMEQGWNESLDRLSTFLHAKKK